MEGQETFWSLQGIVSWVKQYPTFSILAVTVVGWFFVLKVSLRTNRLQLRHSAQLEAYRELYKLKLEIDDESERLGLALGRYSLPFLYMEWADRGGALAEGKSAIQLWNEYIEKLGSYNARFSEKYLRFWNAVNMWSTTMPTLKTAKETLFVELSSLSDKIWKHIGVLRDTSLKQYNWQQWDRKTLEDMAEYMRTLYDQIAVTYLADFMDLVHDELVGLIFGNKRIPREDYNYKEAIVSETLTKEGIKKITYSPIEIALRTQAKRNSTEDPK